MKKSIVIILIFLTNLAIAQQSSIRLQDCYENMLIHYPLAVQSEIYVQTSELNTKNFKAGWLPNASLNAQATYQSDVIKVEITALGNSFGFEGEKDQYKASVDINQLIYDWGRIKSAKQLENANLKVNQQNSLVEINKVKEQINNFYFAILLLQKNKDLLQVMLIDLEAKEKSVESGVKNGVLLNSDLSVLKAEKLKVKQSILEIEIQRLAAIDVLAEITGMTITYDVMLEIPEFSIKESIEYSRPEFVLFDYQKEKLDLTSKLVSKQNKPTVFSFAQLGYGKPGLNMVSDEFDSFYIVGVGLKWNFWDWSKTKREKQIVELNKDLVATQENTFSKQINIALKNEMSKIEIYENAVKSDQEIIDLREEVTESARSKLDNGVITSTDYITELSKETQAKISFETHKIQLIQSKVNYLYIKGEI